MPLCCRDDNMVVGDVGMMPGIEKNSLLLQVSVAASCFRVRGHVVWHLTVWAVGGLRVGIMEWRDATLTRGL